MFTKEIKQTSDDAKKKRKRDNTLLSVNLQGEMGHVVPFYDYNRYSIQIMCPLLYLSKYKQRGNSFFLVCAQK